MTYSTNKKAHFDYEILEKMEAGLMLTGAEVKSIRTNSVKLTGGFITFFGPKPVLTNVHIPKYKYAGQLDDYNAERSRPILLNGKEITYLREKMKEKGLTIIPLSLYNKGRHIKLEIGIAKGKKQYDKRESIKKKDQNREMARQMKGS